MSKLFWLPPWHLQKQVMLQHYAGLLHTLTDLQFDDAQLLDQASMPVFQVGFIKQLCVIKLQVSECVQ